MKVLTDTQQLTSVTVDAEALIQQAAAIKANAEDLASRVRNSNLLRCVLAITSYYFVTARVGSTREGNVFSLSTTGGRGTPVSGHRSLSSLWSHVLSGGGYSLVLSLVLSKVLFQVLTRGWRRGYPSQKKTGDPQTGQGVPLGGTVVPPPRQDRGISP